MITLLGIAFGIGGALIAFKYGDTLARWLGGAAIVLVVACFVPPVANEMNVQLVLSLVCAGLGVLAFDRTRRVQRRAAQQAAAAAATARDATPSKGEHRENDAGGEAQGAAPDDQAETGAPAAATDPDDENRS